MHPASRSSKQMGGGGGDQRTSVGDVYGLGLKMVHITSHTSQMARSKCKEGEEMQSNCAPWMKRNWFQEQSSSL